jgi:homoserine O-acetyltransferase
LRAGHVDPAHFHNTLITNLGIEQRYATIPTFRLETGFVLSNITVAYTCYGTLNERRDNAVVICHAMTGNADPKGSWWKSIFDTPDAVLNDPRLCVFCLNVLGSPYGSTCPLSYIDNDPARGTWGRKFPITTIRDDVR